MLKKTTVLAEVVSFQEAQKKSWVDGFILKGSLGIESRNQRRND